MQERRKTDSHATDVRLYAQLAAAMALYGSATPISKIVAEAMPVFLGAGVRVAIGALLLAPFVGRDWGQLARITWREWRLIALIAVFGMFGFSALLVLGMRMITGVYGAIVMATTPAVTALAAIVLFGEKATWRKVVAIGLAVAGVLVLQLGGAGGQDAGETMREAADPLTRWINTLPTSTLLGMAIVFGAVCCEATYTLVGRTMSQEISPILVAFLAAALAVPLFVPLSFVQWPSFQAGELTVWDVAALLWYGAGTLALGTFLWYSAITRTEGQVAAGFMGLMPVSALILSYALLGESFVWSQLAGFAIVFAGVVLMSVEHAKMASR